MTIHDVLTDAIDAVLTSDISEEACLMANINSDEVAH